MSRPVCLVAFLALVAGCASTPRPLTGDFVVVYPRQAVAGDRTGEPVRWGGTIIAVEPEAQRTCLQILSRPLGRDARPLRRDPDEGRFIACRAGFYDPEVFADGREVTVTGRIAGVVTRTVGEYSYSMPEVAADVIYLWPPRTEYAYYDPAWPAWSLWYGPGWHFGWHVHYTRPVHRPPPRRRHRGR